MSCRVKLFEGARKVLSDRYFTPKQVDKLITKLDHQLLNEPKYLAEIVDRWNILMNRSAMPLEDLECETIPPMAKPPQKSLMSRYKINMCSILADVEPDLLLFEPNKLENRHEKIRNLGIAKNLGEHWTILFNAPRGFYLQDWTDLSKKLYYIEHKIIDLLYDKKEQKEMETHPLVKSAAVIEADFDQIRTRYLFTYRTGYKSLSHMFDVQKALDRPTLTDIILMDNASFLEKFAPFCSDEEYNCFSDLIKNHEIDEDDADIYHRLAELESLNCAPA